MSTQENIQIVKNFLAALGRRDKQGLLALSAEDIEWIIPGEDWPLAGTHRGHTGLADCCRRLPKRWKLRSQSPPISWRRETEFWSSASLRGKSKPRIKRSRTIGSSPLPLGIAN